MARALLTDVDTNVVYSNRCEYSYDDDARKAINQKSSPSMTAKVYPNPANSILNVEVQLQPNEIETMCIYNEMGELIRCENLNSDHTVLLINTLPSGIYLYRITDENGNVINSDKILIVH